MTRFDLSVLDNFLVILATKDTSILICLKRESVEQLKDGGYRRSLMGSLERPDFDGIQLLFVAKESCFFAFATSLKQFLVWTKEFTQDYGPKSALCGIELF